MAFRRRMPRSKLLLAQKMRKSPTRAEALLWERLRGNRTGVPWRQQAPMLGYIVDFWCPQWRIVLEADGPIHRTRVAYDARRDAAMRSRGLTVMRFSNAAIEADPDRVIAQVVARAG